MKFSFSKAKRLQIVYIFQRFDICVNFVFKFKVTSAGK